MGRYYGVGLIPSLNFCKSWVWPKKKMPRPFEGERTVFSTMVLAKLEVHLQKNEVGPLPFTPYPKINSRMDYTTINVIKLIE